MATWKRLEINQRDMYLNFDQISTMEAASSGLGTTIFLAGGQKMTSKLSPEELLALPMAAIGKTTDS